MKAVKGGSVEFNTIKVVRVKRFELNLPPLVEGSNICQKNPYILHGAEPEHSCLMEIEEVYITEQEYLDNMVNYE